MQPSNNNIDENPSFENDKADVPIANEEQKTSLDIQNNSISNTPTITNENLPSDKNPDTVTCSTFTQKEDKKSENHDSKHCDKSQKDDKKKKSSKKKRNVWWIKATVISLVLSAFFSYLSEIVSNAEQIVVVIVLLAFLILSGILFDAIGVAVTSCDTTPIIPWHRARFTVQKRLFGSRKTAIPYPAFATISSAIFSALFRARVRRLWLSKSQ